LKSLSLAATGPSNDAEGFAATHFVLPVLEAPQALPEAALSERKSGGFMQIVVRENNVDQALRALKKKLQREGVYREMKLRRHYEKPSEKRARERAAAVRRARKMERKRLERDGVR
jgi:small subunit ribosomal protein S21